MAEFQDLQLDTTDYRSLYTQREGARGMADISKPILRRKDVNTDGDGFDPSQRFVERMPDGFGAPTDVALVGEEGTFGGNLLPRYLELLHEMPYLCGINARKSIETLADGRIKEVWEFPEGPRNIATDSAWFGSEGEVWALKYGKLMSLMLETERDGDTGGNKSYHFSRIQRNATLPSVGAQNHKTRISAANVAGPLGLSIVAPGLAAKAVSLAIGDSAAAITAKLTAQGLTATVTGGIAAAAGKSQAIVGGADVTVGGVAPNFTTPETAQQYATRVGNAQNPVRTLTGTGLIFKANGPITTGGSPIFSIPGDAAGSPAKAFDGDRSTYWSVLSSQTTEWIGYDRGAGNAAVAKSYQVVSYDDSATNNPSAWQFEGSNDNTNWVSLDTKAGQPLSATNPAAAAIQIANATAFRYYRLKPTANNGGPGITIGELRIFGINPASVNITLADAPAAGAQPDLAVTGAGAVSTSTPPGAGGIVDIEFTNPGNVPIAVSKSSGDANYLLSTPQAGRDGSGYDEIEGPEIHATHWLVFKAATLAALNALNMGDTNTPADEETPAFVQTATGHNVNFENLCQAIYVEDGKINPGTHITRRATVNSSLTLLAQRTVEGNTGIDYAEDVYATDNAGGCGTIPFWLRYAARCASYEMWIDGKWSRNQQAAHPAKEGAAQWQFPLTRIHDRAGSLFLTFIYPAQ